MDRRVAEYNAQKVGNIARLQTKNLNIGAKVGTRYIVMFPDRRKRINATKIYLGYAPTRTTLNALKKDIQGPGENYLQEGQIYDVVTKMRIPPAGWERSQRNSVLGNVRVKVKAVKILKTLETPE